MTAEQRVSLLSLGVNETTLLREALSQIRKGLIGTIIFLCALLSSLTVNTFSRHRGASCLTLLAARQSVDHQVVQWASFMSSEWSVKVKEPENKV